MSTWVNTRTAPKRAHTGPHKLVPHEPERLLAQDKTLGRPLDHHLGHNERLKQDRLSGSRHDADDLGAFGTRVRGRLMCGLGLRGRLDQLVMCQRAEPGLQSRARIGDQREVEPRAPRPLARARKLVCHPGGREECPNLLYKSIL
jgi:hypothetical protein